MGTATLYLRDIREPSPPFPTNRLSASPSYSFNMALDSRESGSYGQYDFQSGTASPFIPYMLSKDSGNVADYHFKDFTVAGSADVNKYVWIKSWASPPIINTAVTLSPSTARFSFVAGIYDNNVVGTTYSVYIQTYLKRSGSTNDFTSVSNLYSGSSTITIPHANGITTFFNSEPIQNTITASYGDKLITDVFLRVANAIPCYSRVYINYNGNYDAFDKSYIYYTTTGYNLSFSNNIRTTLKPQYNLYQSCDREVLSTFDLAGLVSSSRCLRYNIEEPAESYYKFESENSLRGRYSLAITPGVTFPDVDSELLDVIQSSAFIQNRWDEKLASFHKYIMLEDFEVDEMNAVVITNAEEYISLYLVPFRIGYTQMSGSASYDITHAQDLTDPYMIFEYYFESATDLTHYNVLGFLARGEEPTIIDFFVRDWTGNTSVPKSVFINNRFGRYETVVDYSGVNKTKITSAGFITRYSENMLLDDVALLASLEEDRGQEWITVNMTKYSYNRQGKTNTIKIPYGGGEVIQNLGEYNAKGDMTIRTFDNSDALFLNTIENEKIPIYARFKNTGLPIYINNHEVTQRNYVSGSIQSQIAINFTEVYAKRV